MVLRRQSLRVRTEPDQAGAQELKVGQEECGGHGGSWSRTEELKDSKGTVAQKAALSC